MRRSTLPLLLAMSFLFDGMLMPARAADDWMVRESARSVTETVERLTAAIERSGGQVAAVVDHAAGADRAGLALEPTTVVIFGNPRIGTPAIKATRRLALDLPLRVLIWEEEGVTQIGYPSTATLARRYDLPLNDANLRRMEEALGSLTAAALARGTNDAR